MRRNPTSFEIISRDADVRVRVWGETLKDLFRNALRGLASYLREDAGSGNILSDPEKVRQDIDVKAVDVNSLLVEFMSEIVARSDEHGAVFTQASFREFGENFLKGTLSGAKITQSDKSIKAVSYQDVDIKKNPETGMFETILVFDV